jgi:hypothetical protein
VAVLRAHGRAFAPRDEAEQAQLVEGWAEVLAGMADADSPIVRLQVLERTLPDTGDEAARYLQEEMRRPVSDTLVRSYLDLLDDAAPVNREHEALIALQVDARRIAPLVRQFGDRDLAAYVALVQELTSLSERLQAATIGVEGALPPRLLAEAIRVAFDPDARQDMARRALGRPDEAGCEPQLPGLWRPRTTGFATAPTAPGTRCSGSASGRGWTSGRTSCVPCCCGRGPSARSRS